MLPGTPERAAEIKKYRREWESGRPAKSEWHTKPAPSEQYFTGYDQIRWDSDPPTLTRNLANKENTQ
jgi:hypothetical protein